MALFAIWREFKAMSTAEQETLQMLAVAGTRWVPGVRWVRTFGMDLESDKPRSVCIYEGSSREAVVEHSRCCALPVSHVSEVTERASPALRHYGDSGGSQLFLVTRQLTSIPGSREVLNDPNASWLRSFEATDRALTLSLFAGTDAEAVTCFAALCTADLVEPVLESLPEQVAHIYDSLSIPRHWEDAAKVTAVL